LTGQSRDDHSGIQENENHEETKSAKKIEDRESPYARSSILFVSFVSSWFSFS